MANNVTNLDLIQTSQAQKEVVANGFFDAASTAVLFGRRWNGTSGLTWAYYGGTFLSNGAAVQIPNGTLALTANATNYIELDASGAIQLNTIGWHSNYAPLYQVVAGANSVVSYNDMRSYAMSAFAVSTAGQVAPPTPSLLFHFDGPNGGLGMIDYSGSGVTPQNPNNVAGAGQLVTLSTSYSMFGGSSAFFNGNSSHLWSGTGVAVPAVTFGTADFTIDFWAWNGNAGNTNGVLFDSNSVDGAGDGVIIAQNGTSIHCGYLGSSPLITSPNGQFPAGVWTHIAVTRHNGVLNLFINGVPIGNSSTAGNLTSSKFCIGTYSSRNNFFFTGYIDELRVINGTAAWTGAFTSPSAAYPNTAKILINRRDCTSGNLSLGTQEGVCDVTEIFGAPTAAVTVSWPDARTKQVIVANLITSTETVSINTPSGVALTLPTAPSRIVVYADGTSFQQVS